jgi:3-hydroxyisobutyrate dehydrogenase
MIAFFGMGMLGAGFVRALRRRGMEVNVWNRTPAKARALEADGARAFADPSEAARGAERVHLALSDDAAVDEVLERARGGLAPGARIVDHTTTSTAGAVARAGRWRERGTPYVHAPVFMGPQNALESTGTMLISGEPGLVEPLRAPLGAMTGKLVELGPRPDAAAAFKLMGNSFLMAITAGLADLLALAKAAGVSPNEAASLFEFFNPGAQAPVRLKRILDRAFATPSWELAMARKDARLMIEEAARAGVQLAALPAIAARMDAAIAQGHAHDDWTVIAEDALP